MRGSRRRRATDAGLVLSPEPDRIRLRELQAELDTRRDAIADEDLEIETLRDELADFEAYYNQALSEEHAGLRRVENYLRHLRRWSELLRSDPVDDLGTRASRVERTRERELRQTPRVSTPQDSQSSQNEAEHRSPHSSPDRREDRESAPAAVVSKLKVAYRQLARRFHPDLARTEDERLQASKMMVRINSLYRDGDLDRLQALVEQAKGGEIEDVELDIHEQLAMLDERLAWFDAVLENLREEREELEQSPTCALMRNVEQAVANNVDLLGQIRDELRERIEKSYDKVYEAVRRLEGDVTDYNRKRTHLSEAALARRSRGELERRFDPFADKSLIRTGLAEIASTQVSSAAKSLSDRIEAWATERPELLDLALLTYVSELTPFPLDGLETYDGLEYRFYTLHPRDSTPTLGECLVELDEVLEFGIRKATEKVAHLGLRFRKDLHREAMLVAIRSVTVRAALRRVLAVLGSHGACSGCHLSVFFVPVFQLRGLDDLRAQVCPNCGHAESRYWLPRGEDVQSVLNPSYLDLGLVSEWSFRIAHQSIATQLLPVEVDRLRVGDLKQRVVADVLKRHGIDIAANQIELHQDEARVLERTPVADLSGTSFTLRFSSEAEWSERDAVELIRHRVRNRFRDETR
ncbi:MAG: J domain-containing protein [Myxococcota bacterium]